MNSPCFPYSQWLSPEIQSSTCIDLSQGSSDWKEMPVQTVPFIYILDTRRVTNDFGLWIRVVVVVVWIRDPIHTATTAK